MAKLFYGLTAEDYYKTYYEAFNKFFDHLFQDEGGYLPGRQARKLKDPGGATNIGISLRFLIGIGIDRADLDRDGDINNDGVIDEKDIVCLTREQAKDLYFKYFYNPLYEMIDNAEIANRIFNFGVNAGKRAAVKLIQTSVNDYLDATILKVDGKFGKKTLDAINGCLPARKLYDHYSFLIESFYRDLNKPQFFKGWMNRLRKLLNWEKPIKK